MTTEIMQKEQLIENEFYWLVHKLTGEYCALKYRVDRNPPKYSFKESCEAYQSVFDKYLVYGPISVPVDVFERRRNTAPPFFSELDAINKARTEKLDIESRLQLMHSDISKLSSVVSTLQEKETETEDSEALRSLSRRIQLGKEALAKKMAEYAELQGLYKQLEGLVS